MGRPRAIGDALARAAQGFRRRGVEEPRLDAELLLGHALNLDRAAILARLYDPIPVERRGAWAALVRARRRRAPVGYLTGRRGFRDLELRVGPGVLVPRPETEHLVEAALAELDLAGAAPARLIDVGTGSANIALSLALERPRTRVIAVDASPDALAWARRNVDDHGARDRVSLVRARLADLSRLFRAHAFDGVVSNPPYVEPDAPLPAELDHEPRVALVDGAPFPRIYEELVDVAIRLLRRGGFAVFEVGAGQDRAVMEVARRRFERVTAERDLAGIPRVVVARGPFV